ncbi:MAG: lytic murein transglycosylase [Pseudomonadota bacterium]|nr:lytic murein transglycosylase [Pseudomonadota bacterium]
MAWRRRALRSTLAAVVLAWAAVSGSALAACQNTGSFDRWLDGFKKEAAAQGISPATLAVLNGLSFDPGIVKRDRAQGVFGQSFLTFSDRMVAPYRLQRGAALMRQHQATFARIEQQYGVPAPVIVAYWGLETDFGANMGKLPTLRALATLAYDCRRPEKFRPELLDALRIIDRGDLTAREMVGAWAGELGQTQFMPSLYVKCAVDYDGDRRRDLLRSVPDVLASTASCLADFGWQRGQPWLQEVRVPAALPWDQADLAIQHPRSQWARWGVTLADGKPLPSDKMPASLLLPMGRFGPAFLAYPNFQVYLKWNQSVVYSTTAAYFAARLAGASPVHRGTGAAAALSPEQVRELQGLLAKSGHAVGTADGRLGAATRAAVKAAQIKFGLPADSYPTPELFRLLRTGK